MRSFWVFIGLFVNIATVSAADNGLSVTSAYIREVPPGQKVTAAFMEITNAGKQDCSLVGMASPLAGKIEIHSHTHENGVMKMRPVDKVAVAAGDTLMLRPGGYHAMLFRIKGPISDSESYPLTLYFDSCSEVTVNAEVRSPLR